MSKLAKSHDALQKRAAEEEDKDDRLLCAHSKVFKKKPGTPNGSGPVKMKKKEAGEEEEDRKRKPPKEGMITKKEDKKIIKKKVVDKKVSKVTTVENGKKKEKKAYDLLGQKHDPPEERDPLRIFYETLYQQLPNSEMAQYCYMVEHSALVVEHSAFSTLQLPKLLLWTQSGPLLNTTSFVTKKKGRNKRRCHGSKKKQLLNGQRSW